MELTNLEMKTNLWCFSDQIMQVIETLPILHRSLTSGSIVSSFWFRCGLNFSVSYLRMSADTLRHGTQESLVQLRSMDLIRESGTCPGRNGPTR